MRDTLVPLLLAGALWWLPGRAAAQLDGAIPNARVTAGTLSFDGHATVGDFTGTTTEVSGELTGGGELPAVRGWVEAPVRSLETGNGKRDKDLNKSMESDKYPVIRFDLGGVTPESGAGDSASVMLAGRLSLHGVTRDVSFPAQVRMGGGGIRLRCDFPLNLKDYEIGGLSKMLGMLKMQEDIEVHVDLTFGPR
ncbi:MAG: YceI family protein [Gemmatimonadales bacterium]|nr:YceI family protein [Gemmatimonadales bacterium]